MILPEKTIIGFLIGLALLFILLIFSASDYPKKMYQLVSNQFNSELNHNILILKKERDVYQRLAEDYEKQYVALEEKVKILKFERNVLQSKNKELQTKIDKYNTQLSTITNTKDKDELIKILNSLGYSAHINKCQ